MRIESIRLKNFRMFRDVTIHHLPNFCVFIGANGTGKSSLFGLFSFLRDALTYNVKEALAKRGGFKEVAGRQTEEPIEIELKFRGLKSSASTVTYHLVIGLLDQRPVVQRELLKYRPNQNPTGDTPPYFINFRFGKGYAFSERGDPNTPTEQELGAPDLLAIKELGQLPQFRMVSEICRFMEDWHISDFQLHEVKISERAINYDEHLSPLGDNLALFAHYLQTQRPEVYKKIMQQLKRRIPGFSHIDAILEGERVYLKFWQTAFADPFFPGQVSAGTLTLFAYSLLLQDPKPHSLLCVEEPEKQIYPNLLMGLADEFRSYTKKGGQVFVSTHSPNFLDGVKLQEIFWLIPQKDGSTQIQSAARDHLLDSLTQVGDLPGELWSQGLFRGVHPV